MTDDLEDVARELRHEAYVAACNFMRIHREMFGWVEEDKRDQVVLCLAALYLEGYFAGLKNVKVAVQ